MSKALGSRKSAIPRSAPHNWSLGLLKAVVLLMVTLRARSVTAFGGAFTGSRSGLLMSSRRDRSFERGCAALASATQSLRPRAALARASLPGRGIAHRRPGEPPARRDRRFPSLFDGSGLRNKPEITGSGGRL